MSGARHLLTRTRTRIDPRYRHALDRMPQGVRHLLGYHAGLWDEDGTPREPAGKAFAAALALATARAAGAQDDQAALSAAVAVEMIHDASLLHDDIIDGDRTRRGRPAAWTVFGTGATLCAGVALLHTAPQLLPPHQAADLTVVTCRIYEGQIDDLAFETRLETSWDQYLVMAEKKTAVLLAAACGLGAAAGGAPPEAVAHYREFGRALGIAYQISDDILGIWGKPEVTGKPVHSDLTSGKKSAPVIAALTSDTAPGRSLHALYSEHPTLTSTQAAHAAALIEQTGARTHSETAADHWAQRAHSALDRAAPSHRTDLETLANAAIRRGR